MTEPGSRPCRACGKKLLFVRDTEGKLQPLDMVAPVYAVRPDAYGELVAVRANESYVSHFATCPNAGEFSKSKAGAE